MGRIEWGVHVTSFSHLSLFFSQKWNENESNEKVIRP